VIAGIAVIARDRKTKAKNAEFSLEASGEE